MLFDEEGHGNVDVMIAASVSAHESRPSFGSALRRTREEHGISLDDVARDTCLSKRYLLALEREARDDLPGDPYNRAYLRTYATYLKLDATNLMEAYAQAEAVQSAAGRLAARPDVRDMMRLAADRQGQELSHGGGIGTIAGLRGAVIGAIAVAFAIGFGWVVAQRSSTGDAPVPEPVLERPALVSHDATPAPEPRTSAPEPPTSVAEPRTSAPEPPQHQRRGGTRRRHRRSVPKHDRGMRPRRRACRFHVPAWGPASWPVSSWGDQTRSSWARA